MSWYKEQWNYFTDASGNDVTDDKQLLWNVKTSSPEPVLLSEARIVVTRNNRNKLICQVRALTKTNKVKKNCRGKSK